MGRPALVEVQRIRTLRESFDDRFDVLVLILDEDSEMAGIFAEKFEVTDIMGWVTSSDALVKDDGPFGPIGMIPTSVLLNAQGEIVMRSDGPWPPGSLEKGIEALLNR